jgi:hypothetical protein
VHRGTHTFEYYETQEFWDYVDAYAAFIKEHEYLIETYVNVDVIYNPELSWKVQKYLEDKGLKPIPVFHPGESLSWLQKYIDAGYNYIGIGGLGQTTTKEKWKMVVGDPAWEMICDSKGIPQVKIHGFAMTSPDLIIEYPYFSVDSTSWMQFGKYGMIIIPKKKNGKFVYEESPHIISVSARKAKKSEYDHFENLPKINQQHILEYLEMKGIPMGKSILEDETFTKNMSELPISKKSVSSVEKIIEVGVCNNGDLRDQINLDYYLDLESYIPTWPRKWRKRKQSVTRLPI